MRSISHRVELAGARLLREVGAELRKRGIGSALCGVEARAHRNSRLADEVVQLGADRVTRDAHAVAHVGRGAAVLAHDAEQQVLGVDEALPHLHGLAQGVLQHALHARGEAEVARHVGRLINRDDLAYVGDNVVVVDVQRLERLGRKAVLLLDERKQQVFGAHIGLMQASRFVLREHQHLAGLVCEFLERHGCSLLC